MAADCNKNEDYTNFFEDEDIDINDIDYDEIIGYEDLEDNNTEDYFKHQEHQEYHKLLSRIVSLSFKTLRTQGFRKEKHKKIFRNFFLIFLAFQFAVIFTLVYLKGFKLIELTDTAINILSSSFFVESLAIVTIMVTHIFSSKGEKGIIDAIRKVAENYKKRDK